jgi:pimeloyl-ACP methyl ester carboxylesterase
MQSDPVATDVTEADWQYPTSNAGVTFETDGARLLGMIHIAQGVGPHPAILLLHGIPGYERNFDLAHTLRRAGWNVLVFHYRGNWGSQGTYSFQHVLEDVRSAIAFLRSESSSKAYRIDIGKIVVIGHSLGGFAALVTAIADPQLRAVVAIATFDLGVIARMLRSGSTHSDEIRRFLDSTLPPLHGASTQTLVDEMLSYGDHWYLPEQAAELADRSLLFIDATRDDIAPSVQHTVALVDALKACHARDLTHVTLDSDHAFTNKRIALARTVIEWLKSR